MNNITYLVTRYSALAQAIGENGSTRAFKNSMQQQSMEEVLNQTEVKIRSLTIGVGFQEIDNLSNLKQSLEQICKKEQQIHNDWLSQSRNSLWKRFFNLKSGLYKVSLLKRIFGSNEAFDREREKILQSLAKTIATVTHVVSSVLKAKEKITTPTPTPTIIPTHHEPGKFTEKSWSAYVLSGVKKALNMTAEVVSNVFCKCKRETKAVSLTRGSDNSDSNERSQRVMQRLVSCEVTKSLYDAASAILVGDKKGQWSLRFCEDSSLNLDVNVDVDLRSISLKKSLTDDQALSKVMYQLLLIINSSRIDEVEKKLFQNKITPEEFQVELRKIEHEAFLKHHAIILSYKRERGKSLSEEYFSSQPIVNSNPSSKEDFETFYKKSWSRFTPTQVELEVHSESLDQEKMCKLIKKVMTSRVTRALCKAAYETHPYGRMEKWKIKMVPTLEFEANCDSYNRVINIRQNATDENGMLCSLIFELTNAVSSLRFKEVHQKACDGHLSQEEYVKSMEEIEFEGSLKHHEIMVTAIKEDRWASELDYYRNNTSYTFETYWKNIENSAHAECYRKWWIQFFSSRYKARHPKENRSIEKKSICQRLTSWRSTSTG